METITNTKTYLITAAIAATIGIIGGTQLSTTPTTPTTIDVVTPDTTTQVTLSSYVKDDLGTLRYNIVDGLSTHEFVNFEQMEKWANETDSFDDAESKNLRLILKQEFQNQTPEEYFNSIKQ